MPDDDNLIEFLDDDLRAELEQYKSGPGASVMRGIILEKQRKRQARREMTPVQRRRDMARDALQADVLKDADRYHIHSVLAMCGLPYRRPDDGAVEYIQRYGRNSLVVTAGRLQDPESRPDGAPGPALWAEGAADDAAYLHRGAQERQQRHPCRRQHVGLHPRARLPGLRRQERHDPACSRNRSTGWRPRT